MDEKQMIELTRKFLASHSTGAVEEFRQLIAEMTQKSVTKVLLTYHPSYQMGLGIAGTDKGRDALETKRLTLVSNYDDEYDSFVASHDIPRDEHGDDDEWIDEEYSWEWIRNAWLAAEGDKSDRVAVMLDNGMDIAMDLTTGEEPDPALGFDQIG